MRVAETRQLAVIEQALETAARMLGSDKSRGYMLEMICADFLAGANADNGNSNALMISLDRLFVCFRTHSSKISQQN